MTQVVTDPFVCPRCGSTHVTYTKDASLAYTQKIFDDGTVVIGDGDVAEFDTILDAECLDCGYVDTSGDVSAVDWTRTTQE